VHLYIFTRICVYTHAYLLHARATVRCTQCRARIGNWEGGFPGRKVVGGNKALGTALLRPLIWLARQMFYMYVRTTLGNNSGTGYVRQIGEPAQARIPYDTSLSRNAVGDEEDCETNLAIPDESSRGVIRNKTAIASCVAGEFDKHKARRGRGRTGVLRINFTRCSLSLSLSLFGSDEANWANSR